MYFPEQGTIQVHQQQIQICQFPAGYYWYGAKSVGPGRPPKWVNRMLGSCKPSQELTGLTDPSMESLDYTDCPDNIVSNADTPIVTSQDIMSCKMLVKDDEVGIQQQIYMDDKDGVQQHQTDQTTSPGVQWKTRTSTIVPPQRYKT